MTENHVPEQATPPREPREIASQFHERTTADSKPKMGENYLIEQAKVNREPFDIASQALKRTIRWSKPRC